MSIHTKPDHIRLRYMSVHQSTNHAETWGSIPGRDGAKSLK